MEGGRIVVTGAGGFVGRALAARLPRGFAALSLGAPDWRSRLAAADLGGATVFHLAGRVPRGRRDDDAYFADNAAKTRVLAQAAARQGARRLVFLSSLKVHGDESGARPLREDDPPAPADAYARSKVAAEKALAEVSAAGRLDASVVRAPLFYGPGARANLLALLRLADSPWWLPFAALDSRRAFLHVDDLARLLVDCAVHPHAAGRTYLAAGEATISTRELVSLARRFLGRRERLFAVPARALEAAAALLGEGARMRVLTRPLLVDASAALRELGWSACVGVEEAVEDTVRAYREVVA